MGEERELCQYPTLPTVRALWENSIIALILQLRQAQIASNFNNGSHSELQQDRDVGALGLQGSSPGLPQHSHEQAPKIYFPERT